MTVAEFKVATETVYPTKLKIFITWTFTKKVRQPLCYIGFLVLRDSKDSVWGMLKNETWGLGGVAQLVGKLSCAPVTGTP